jgi:hypothetical protein
MNVFNKMRCLGHKSDIWVYPMPRCRFGSVGCVMFLRQLPVDTLVWITSRSSLILVGTSVGPRHDLTRSPYLRLTPLFNDRLPSNRQSVLQGIASNSQLPHRRRYRPCNQYTHFRHLNLLEVPIL